MAKTKPKSTPKPAAKRTPTGPPTDPPVLTAAAQSPDPAALLADLADRIELRRADLYAPGRNPFAPVLTLTVEDARRVLTAAGRGPGAG